MLPYFEGDDKSLYGEFHLDEPWDSELNKRLIAKMPAVYRCPRPRSPTRDAPCIRAPRGEATMFPGPSQVSVRNITDGTSNSIALVEADDDHAVIWTRPDDWEFDPDRPTAGLGGHMPGYIRFLFADGAVHLLHDNVDQETLRKLFTRAGGEVVTIPTD